MHILLVGGTWTSEENTEDHIKRESSIVKKIAEYVPKCKALNENPEIASKYTFKMYNGGKFSDLKSIITLTKYADITIWMPNIPDNNLPKIRNVKTIAPHTILITSKRNTDNKYEFGEIVRRALKTKSNLLIEFKLNSETKKYSMNLIDPLGNSWFEGENIEAFVEALFTRAVRLTTISRKMTRQAEGAFHINIEDKEIDKFMEIVKRCAVIFNEYTPSANNTTRFLGNCSLAPTRCSKGFPSMRTKNGILVSRRNVDKTHLTKEHLVPVTFDETEILMDYQIRYYGDNKPSVDTPIQIKLYNELPNINYMIHSHCYIKNAPFTKECIPCGGLQEIKEILDIIDTKLYGRTALYFAINLKGHGSIVMANNIALFNNIEKEYYPREFPEKQY